MLNPFTIISQSIRVVGVPFNRYMTKTSEQHTTAILGSYDLSQVHTLVDVGEARVVLSPLFCKCIRRFKASSSISQRLYKLRPVSMAWASRSGASSLGVTCSSSCALEGIFT